MLSPSRLQHYPKVLAIAARPRASFSIVKRNLFVIRDQLEGAAGGMRKRMWLIVDRRFPLQSTQLTLGLNSLSRETVNVGDVTRFK